MYSTTKFSQYSDGLERTVFPHKHINKYTNYYETTSTMSLRFANSFPDDANLRRNPDWKAAADDNVNLP